MDVPVSHWKADHPAEIRVWSALAHARSQKSTILSPPEIERLTRDMCRMAFASCTFNVLHSFACKTATVPPEIVGDNPPETTPPGDNPLARKASS